MEVLGSSPSEARLVNGLPRFAASAGGAVVGAGDGAGATNVGLGDLARLFVLLPGLS